MTQQQRIDLYEAWREIDNASQRIMTAQARDMTAAAERLEKARIVLNDVVMSLTA